MKPCPVCGYPNPDDANYCIRCGYRFPTPTLRLTPFTPYWRDEIEGLQRVKEFAKYRLIGLVAWIISIVLLIVWVSSSPYTFNSLNYSTFLALASEFGLIAAVSISFLVGIAFSLLGIYYLRLGYARLNSITNQFGIALGGTNVIIAGLIAMGVSALTLLLGLTLNLPEVALASIIGIVVGAIIELIGEILAIGFGGSELSSRYKVSTIEWGGILYLVGLFAFVILSIIGLVLFYNGTNDAINRVKASVGTTWFRV